MARGREILQSQKRRKHALSPTLARQTNRAFAVLVRLRQVFRAAKQQMPSENGARIITALERWAMHEMYTKPGIRVTDLAHTMGLHQSTISNMVRALSRRELAG